MKRYFKLILFGVCSGMGTGIGLVAVDVQRLEAAYRYLLGAFYQ
jgi:hypothetical protein